MTPRDCFGIVVRSSGLFTLLLGLHYIEQGVFMILAPINEFREQQAFGVLYSVFIIAISLYLLRGAPRLMRFAYPEG